MITDGIININKPQNMTSHDVVSIVRRTLGIKRVGHTGTLDPMATGVLPIAIGRSTRVIEYLDLDMKKYRCKLMLGIETDTQDIWGNVIKTLDTKSLKKEEILKAFEPFKGLIDQKPPMYSAIKVNGKRLYEYARKGETVDVKSRKIYIKDLQIEEIDMEESFVVFTVECTKGTYIRTICQDVGSSLGCGATMGSLVRIASGRFLIEDAIDLECFKEMDKESLKKVVYKTEYPLTHFGKIVLNSDMGKKFVDGWHIPLELCEIIKEPEFKEKEFYIPIREEYKNAYNIYADNNGNEEFLGVAFFNFKYKKLVADKVFFRGENNADI